MTIIRTYLLFALMACAPMAIADIWKWTDANGDVHFVDSNKPIFTWTDKAGKVFYSDKPDHEGAVSVELTWVSAGSLPQQVVHEDDKTKDGFAFTGETEAERAAREKAESYYCERAQKMYDAYTAADKLYKTDENGERVYLSVKEIQSTLQETEAVIDEWCH